MELLLQILEFHCQKKQRSIIYLNHYGISGFVKITVLQIFEHLGIAILPTDAFLYKSFERFSIEKNIRLTDKYK